jgi:hypothetical protein
MPGPDSRRPEQLDAEAAKAFATGTTAQCLKAADLWRRAGDGYIAGGRPTEGSGALRNAGRAMACAGDSEAALGYYGRAAELDDAAGSHELLVLLDGSPLYDATSRSVAEDARFVGAVNQLLGKLSPGQAVSVTSAEDAQRVLEDLAARRLAPITVKTASGPVDVELRRWFYSMTQPNALWERVTTDTTIQRPPAAYHFRYRVPTTGRDTTVMNRCADGCTIVIH